MLKNFFKITIRNLLRNKVYSFINIFGLSIGIACFILISLFVKDELTYDTFNKNADRVFRLNSYYKIGENRFNLANSPVPLGPVLKEEYPEIKNIVRIQYGYNSYVKKGDEYIQEENFLYADSTLFDIFSIEFVTGNPKTALTKPNSIVITTRAAEKFFSGKNPMGERVILSNKTEFLVTGVVNPLPKNSHFEFDFAASFNSLPENGETNWFGTFVHTYVLTDKVVSAEQLNKRLFATIDKHVGPIIKAAFGTSYREFLDNGNDFSFKFVPLTDIHLYSYNIFNELKPTADINTVYLFSAIALFILIIACINFVNLATAKSTKRANEIGVRKVLGSNKAQLIRQFLSESIILCFISVIISLMIIEIVLPYFNNLTQKELTVNYLGNLFVIPVIAAFTILLGSIAGMYPALLLASFKPVLVLKGKIYKGTNKSFLRKGLVVFQFATSIVLFIGTLVIYNQMEYIKNKNLGFNKEQMLVVKNVDDLTEQQASFTDEIKKYPGIKNATLSKGLPVFSLDANIYRKEGSNDNQTLITLKTDYNFLDTYEIKLKDGRSFRREMSTDTACIILNESAVKKIGFTDPINSKLTLVSSDNPPAYTVIGIVKDFHLQTLKDEIRPAAIVLLKQPEANFLSVKVSSANVEETIEYLSDKWKDFGQSKPIEYTFFDENFGEIYRAEIQTGEIFTIFAVLAIVIACLGLFGLAAFTAEQRTKEIGIRKVLGSSVLQIIILLSKEFVKWVLLANIIAWPVAYYIMDNWLDDFIYRIDIDVSTFLITGLAALVIAVLTISYQAIKAAIINPAKVLKTE
ncbi:MAG: ABC transporter permease [Ignavibacteriaceae bacterium]